MLIFTLSGTYTKCYLCKILPIDNVTYAKCYLCIMLPMQSVLYESEPMQNVTMQKCTLHYVTDLQIWDSFI